MAPNNSRHDVHYELQARQGSSWIILDLYQAEEKATKACERAWKGGSYKAIRVIREKFDPRRNTFDSIELTYRGRKFKPSKYDGEGGSVICRTPADLYSYESRMLIAGLLVEKFNSWQITASELLHCPKHYYRLDNSGQTLQGAIQRAAVAQVKVMDEKVQDRIKAIYALIDRAVLRVKADWEAEVIPDIADEGIEGVIERLADKGQERKFLLSAALARDFLYHGGFAEKIHRMVALMNEDHPEWVLRIADGYLSEFLAAGTVALDFIGRRENLGETLVAMARLARGGGGAGDEEAPVGPGNSHSEAPEDDVAVLQKFLEARLLPFTRRALLGAIARALSTSTRLAGGPLDGELAALSRLVAALGESTDELLGEVTLVDVLEDRCSRFLNPQFVAEYLEDVESPDETVRKLLDLEAHCIGRQNKRRVANYILPVLASSDSEQYFTGAGGNKLDRMRYLAKLQAAVKASGMREAHKEPMCEKLDHFCTVLLKTSKLFTRLDQTSKNPLDAAKNLLAMIAGDCFTEGTASTAARAKAKIYMAEPELMALIGAPEDSQSPESIALHRLIQMAGMDSMLDQLRAEDAGYA